ncbi:serine/arginine repetitive matrix protein 2 isoform X1 [Colius striatus]|uniref:serine/arginine repetitive matrix protein 2 isoform X1 n=2 Tax=Colius striatus TaxID=57412 RepID=UPI002B1D39D3|nr:serine/arginine repetitive matrix protein 2 isoform X1 [Colius striatus]
MYNGIGLPTPRGSGTNGYVQRNLSALRHKKEARGGGAGAAGEAPPAEEELRRLEAGLAKRPNADILDHQRKRNVELKCLELSELMEEQGYEEGEIQAKVATFRMMLLEKDVAVGGDPPEQRPTVTETHQLAEANERKNERLRAAFGIGDAYVGGSAFDPARRAKDAKDAPPDGPPPASSRSPSPKQKKKKKKKDRGRSASRSGERKKSSKKKKHRSESEAKKRKHRSPSPKTKHKAKEKKRKRSTSESASQKSRRDARSSSPAASSSSSGSSRSRRSRSRSSPRRHRSRRP